MICAGLALRAPIWPLHGWFTSVAQEAPPSVLVALSAITVPATAYIFIRLGYTLFPDTVAAAAPVIVAVGVVNLLCRRHLRGRADGAQASACLHLHRRAGAFAHRAGIAERSGCGWARYISSSSLAWRSRASGFSPGWSPSASGTRLFDPATRRSRVWAGSRRRRPRRRWWRA